MEIIDAALAAPDSSLASLIESLIGEYWDIAHEEGKTGISQGDLANQVLGRIRNALKANAAPQDQDAKDAARYRWLRYAPHNSRGVPFIAISSAGSVAQCVGEFADCSLDAAMEPKP